MKFFLEVKIPDYPFYLDHHQKVFMSGSCFSEHIHQYMIQNGMHSFSNPWGILFHPFSLAEMIEKLIHPENLSDVIIPVNREGAWYSLHQHSSIYGETEKDLIRKVETITNAASQNFKDSETLVVTFGTSYVYEYLPKGNAIIANCQKVPQKLFRKRRLSVQEITDRWSELIRKIPQQRIIFTISPVRHSKDGLVENNVSKSILIMAVQQLIEKFPQKCFYFPSYELVMDELRDYRFFKEDLVHPNKVATRYVWEKWREAMFSNQTKDIAHKFNQLYLFSQHRSLKNTDDTYWKRWEELKTSLQNQYPYLNYSTLSVM